MFFYFKRVFDLIIALLFFVLVLPLLFIASLSILIIDLQSPFFIQERSGLYGKKINIYKLKTMKFINGHKKVTILGKILRLSKIDELPQLINVLRNEMSIIGPRPLYVDFNNYYKKNHKSRLSIKPGITGLAQIKVRDATDWYKKFNFDIIYVKKISIKLDCYILFKTIIIIINSLFSKKNRIIESYDYKKSFFENYL